MDEARVFLSYARGDDEQFVRRLYDDLTAAGFDVWFDRVDLPSRQLTFHQEIKDAIRARDRVLLVAGPRAADSDYVQEECQFALECDKGVVPILRSGDFGVIPERIGRIHCEDFRDDSNYRDQLVKLITNLRLPLPRLGRLFAVPELPKSYIARTGLLREIKDVLLIDTRAPVVASGGATRMGLHGMGGIGKSLLAAAVARDPEVRRTYPDAVIWLHCGPQPEPVQLQRQIAIALGAEPTVGNEAQGQGVIWTALRDKAVLLVFDDVSEAAHVVRVGELGPRCRALLTTRDAGILRSLQCAVVPVQLLSEEESLHLLADAVGGDPASLPREARAIMFECGRLPLALALCAGLLRGAHGMSWADVLEALKHAQLEDIADDQAVDARHRDLRKAIQVSVDLLDSDERKRWAELSVFARDKSVPATAVYLFWAHTGGLSEFACKRLLMRLTERSLIDLDPTSATDLRESGDRVSMHDLLFAFATGIAGDHKTLQRRFADAVWTAYVARADCFKGYVKDHLPRFLVAADEPQRLLEIIADTRLDYFQQWAEQGFANEGAECLEYLVRSPIIAADSEELVRPLATQLARLHNRRGDDGAAERWLTVALAGLRKGAPANRADAVALHELASLALARGNYRQARIGYRRALRLARRLSVPAAGEIAANLIGLAAVNNLSRQRASRKLRTLRLARLALQFAETEQDAPHMAEACRLIADEYDAEMEYADAERYLTKGLAVAEEADLSEARISLLTSRAWMLCQRAELGVGSPGEAELAFREVMRVAAPDLDWRVESDAWSGLGLVALLRADFELLDQAIDRLTALLAGRTRNAVEARLRLFEATRTYSAQHFTEAAKQFSDCADFCFQAGLWSRQADALVGRRAALLACGEVTEAAKCRGQVEEMLGHCPRVRQVLARACLDAGQCAGLRKAGTP